MVACLLWSQCLPALTSILWVSGPAKAILFGSWRMHQLSGGLHAKGKGREVLMAAQTTFESAPEWIGIGQWLLDFHLQNFAVMHDPLR